MRDRENGKSTFVATATMHLLCAYCFIKRGVRSQARPGVRSMRAVREEFYKSMWRSAAEATGASFSALPDGTAEIRRSNQLIKVCANKTSLDDPATVSRAGNKLLVSQLLARAGI